MTFQEKVKTARKQLGLSQEDMARELSVSFATVNRWENSCECKPSRLALRSFDDLCERKNIRFDEVE